MAYNPYIHRTGARAGSAMKMRNEYQIQFGIQYYLIVEGESDEHFFENILDCSKCKVMNLEGKAEVKKFIEDQNSANKKGYLGIVDADFEHIDGYEEQVKNVIITDVHDIEMLMFSSNPNMRRIYSELTENMIINNFEEKHQKSFLDSIIKVAYDIGLLKMVMKRPKYYVNMKDIFYSDIINKEFDSLISYKEIGEITKDMIECHNNKNNDGIRLNITKLIDIENQKEQTFKTTEDMRSTGLIMSLCISIPLMFFPVITLINETLSNVEWLGLVLELISIIFFEIVELYGNNLHEKKRRLIK